MRSANPPACFQATPKARPHRLPAACSSAPYRLRFVAVRPQKRPYPGSAIWRPCQKRRKSNPALTLLLLEP